MAFAFIKHDTHIDFIGKRHIAYALSALLLLVGLASAIWGNGLRLGIDFAGGVVSQVEFTQAVADEALKKSLTTTSLPGVFAAGDCRVKSVRQLTTAVGDGAVAGLAASRYVDDRR